MTIEEMRAALADWGEFKERRAGPVRACPMFRPGDCIVYNDGREGHSGVRAVVLEVESGGMHVSFEDRADVDFIRFDSREWMDHITIDPSLRVDC